MITHLNEIAGNAYSNIVAHWAQQLLFNALNVVGVAGLAMLKEGKWNVYVATRVGKDRAGLKQVFECVFVLAVYFSSTHLYMG
ncbi:hypothetical protein GCM10011247_33200 [Pseudomonas plecoglossicida]|nr:hypothetical protein GCM10011247_33200 [Pseudomonas plecoglossicida]